MAKKESFREVAFKFYILILAAIVFSVYSKNIKTGLIVFLTILFLSLAIYILYKKNKKNIFFENRKTLEDLRILKPSEFEEFIAHLFQKMGYKTETVGGTSDGGIDVIAERDGAKHYIQCKKFITRQVGAGDMRDFYGAVTDKLTNAKSFFITTNVFTEEAKIFAEGKPIELIDGSKLMEYIHIAGIDIPNPNRPVFGYAVAEKCSWCGSQLVRRTAHKGPNAGKDFYGCSSYPRCKFIKNIS